MFGLDPPLNLAGLRNTKADPSAERRIDARPFGMIALQQGPVLFRRLLERVRAGLRGSGDKSALVQSFIEFTGLIHGAPFASLIHPTSYGFVGEEANRVRPPLGENRQSRTSNRRW